MATRMPKKTITVADVEKTNGFMALRSMAQELQISVPMSKENITSLKTILIEHLTRGGGSALVKEPKTWDTTSAASSEDLSNRLQLSKFYSHTLKYVEKLPKPFQMNLDQLFPHYIQQMKQFAEELKKSKCVLLVAGETGAGKTSLVNLLLGMSILPTSDLQCTAAIVEIQYGPEPYAEMHFVDDSSGRSTQPIKAMCKDDKNVEGFIKELEYHITLRDPETEESPYEKIQIYWPLEMLKGGATIVDSPGVGDSRALPRQLEAYMERAFGFIYVIDITVAIHKHRLGQLLLKATENNNDVFDQDTAMFVCNRWDQVRPEDRERVTKALADRLSMLLPDIKKSQLFPISIKDSRAAVQYGQVTREHQHLIEGIRNFLPLTMRAKLRIYYRYLSSLLKRSLYALRLSYLDTKNSVSRMQTEATKRDKRKQMLQRNAQEKLDSMRLEVKTATIQASESLLQYLNSMHTITRINSWRELPRRDKWQNVLKNANMIISERLAAEIDEWEHGSNVVNQVGKVIVGKFQKQFELFAEEITQVEDVFLDSDDTKSKVIIDYNHAMQRNANPKKMKVHLKTKDAGFLSLGTSIASHLNLDPKDPFVRKIFKDNYDRDPKMAMQEATNCYLALLTDANAITMIGKFFDKFVKGIDRVGKLVPHLMKADQNLLEDIKKQLTDNEAKLEMFPHLSKDCSNLQGELDMLYLKRLMKLDFTADTFTYTDKDRLGKGSFATVYKARLGDKNVALKEPKQSITKFDVTDVLLEESILRETTHKNIVSYHGAYRKGADDGIYLNIVMEYCPYTMKDRYINSKNSPSQHGDNIMRQVDAIGVMTNFLIQVCSGLSYLHNKNIVHRDLKSENLLLTEDNVVKIADLGLAKKVKEIVTLCIGTPVYMAPEVLLKTDTYDTKADIFSFGMITWELWYGQDLAQYAAMELQGRLKDNIENRWRPSLKMVSAPTEFWAKLITMCWDQEPKNRPTTKDIGTKLVEVHQQVQEFKQKHSKK